MKTIDSIALFGTYCICLTNYTDLIVMRRSIENKHLICVAKQKSIDHKQKAFQTNDMEIRYDCALLREALPYFAYELC